MMRRTLYSIVALSVVSMACGRDQGLEDGLAALHADYGSRNKADAEFLNWTIDLHSCSGSLLTRDYMITAEHCSPRRGQTYQSGATLNSQEDDDITVEQVLEEDVRLDYAILKISWKSGQPPPNQKMPPLVAISPEQVEISEEVDKGDEVFTVGFPADREQWRGTFSDGRLRRLNDYTVEFSVPIWNGNSGGGLWRKKDHMLVSLTNEGPNTGNRESENSSDWNAGAPFWIIYEHSTKLKELFPDGRNKEVPLPQDPSQTLYVAIDSFAGATEGGLVWVSAPLAASSVALCVNQSDCLTGATPTARGSLVQDIGTRRIFRFDQRIIFAEGLQLTFASADINGKKQLTRTIQLRKK